MTQGDEPEPLEHWVFRAIRKQLDEGGLDRLTRALSAVQAATGSEEPIRADASLQGEGKVTGGVTVSPASAVIRLIPGTPMVSVGEAVHAIRSASPELAKEIETRTPQDAMLVLTRFMAFVAALQALLTLYQVVHGQPALPTQVVEIFNQT
jgi:hypothetical protein